MPGPGHQTNEIQSNNRLLEAFCVQKTYSAVYTSMAVQIAETSVHLIWLVPVLYWVLTTLNIIPDCEENKAGCLEIDHLIHCTIEIPSPMLRIPKSTALALTFLNSQTEFLRAPWVLYPDEGPTGRCCVYHTQHI